MIVRKNLDIKVVIKVGWKRVTSLALISSLVVFAYHHLWLDVSIDTLPASILGVAIAFLIGFRVNSAYERWWEARKLWGAITNDSRSISRQVLTLFTANAGNHSDSQLVHLQRQFIKRQIASCYALKNTLRKHDALKEITSFVSEEEQNYLSTQKNIPNAILLLQGKALQEARQLGYVDEFRMLQIDTRINALADSMGGRERIKNTVFPRQYSYYSTLFVKIYSFMLPFLFVNSSGWITVPFTIIIGFIFFALDTIAGGIENPFENTLNDTPMNAICRNIEINLLQMLDEKDIPSPVEAKNGFLY